mgnify:CR=1 FL=1|tara:strand:- start:982 stop:1338 length:357 start_codon:yes stop_codon:yes gene_type:complete
MKLQPKDDVIWRLMLSLKRDNMFISTNDAHNDYLFNLNKGWIEALEWVLNIKKDITTDTMSYSKGEIISAVDITIGDDGMRSKEVIAVLESERKDNVVRISDVNKEISKEWKKEKDNE